MPKAFTSLDGRFHVLLQPAALQEMLDCCAAASPNETGGILVGRLQDSTGAAIITEATPHPEDSEKGRWFFRRGVAGLRALLQQRWKYGEYYLGEWHFHPGGSSNASFCDDRAMSRIARSDRYGCSEPILIVIGGDPPNRWDLSVSVYPAKGPISRCRAG